MGLSPWPVSGTYLRSTHGVSRSWRREVHGGSYQSQNLSMGPSPSPMVPNGPFAMVKGWTDGGWGWRGTRAREWSTNADAKGAKRAKARARRVRAISRLPSYEGLALDPWLHTASQHGRRSLPFVGMYLSDVYATEKIYLERSIQKHVALPQLVNNHGRRKRKKKKKNGRPYCRLSRVATH